MRLHCACMGAAVFAVCSRPAPQWYTLLPCWQRADRPCLGAAVMGKPL